MQPRLQSFTSLQATERIALVRKSPRSQPIEKFIFSYVASLHLQPGEPAVFEAGESLHIS